MMTSAPSSTGPGRTCYPRNLGQRFCGPSLLARQLAAIGVVSMLLVLCHRHGIVHAAAAGAVLLQMQMQRLVQIHLLRCR